MSFVIDRRLNSRHKSTVNRQRFLKRYRSHIQKAVKEAVKSRSITDLERGEEITIPGDDISEPVFAHGQGGRRTMVHPGNREFVAGDRVPRPPGADGTGGVGGQASNSGEGLDDFVFQLSQEEFLEFLFEDLELPNLVKRYLKGNDSFKFAPAGYSHTGVPAKLSVARTMRMAKSRRIALSGTTRRRLKECLVEVKEAEEEGDEVRIKALEKEIRALECRINRVPFLDTYDLRYNLHVKQPVPTSKAVMFCLMDVSGSMDQQIKDLAKRFYLLLYLFLKRNYDKTEVVFVRHHTLAKEVDEQEFFYSRETGGTVVSSALKLMHEIVTERYSPQQWNIYAAQASDGDNWNDDSPMCRKILAQKLLPLVQYFAYVEITRRDHQALWREYEKVADQFPETFAQRHIVDVSDVYPAFCDLFQRKVHA